jgi:hypothetical protein
MHDAPHWLPAGHAADILDPDVPKLRRDDGSMVAAFSSRGSTPGALVRGMDNDRVRAQQAIRDAAGNAPDPRARRDRSEALAFGFVIRKRAHTAGCVSIDRCARLAT